MIPVAIAFFTWWFGASRAEKQKEQQELQKNLDFLVSVCLASINGLKFLHGKLHVVEKKEFEAVKTITNKGNVDSDEVCYGFLFDDVFKTINVEKYASCISYNPNFIVDMVRVKSLLRSTEYYVNQRNDIIKSISECENMTIKLQRLLSFIPNDHEQIESFIADVCRITILIRNLIGDVVKLNQEISDLKLTPQLFTDEQMIFIKKAENEYTEYTKQHKEQNNSEE